MEINQIILSLFFTYFVLMMTDIHTILNCSLQRFLKENIWIKHFTIFSSIFIFTFVLGWYRFDSIVVEYFNDTNKNKTGDGVNITINNILWHYLKNTFIIYILFIISTKNEGIYLSIFLISSLILFLLQVYTKSINKIFHRHIYKYYYIGEKEKYKIFNELQVETEKDRKNLNFIILSHNTTCIVFIVVILLLVYGMYSYYIKKKKVYKTKFGLTKFIFGTNKCTTTSI
jgi:hypothetical protein